MLTLTLSETEVSALQGALELARDKYRENARDLSGSAHVRLAAQFDYQAKNCEALLNKLEA